VVTDVVMPQLGGPALVEQLVQTRPGIKVIYMSGYTNNALITQDRRECAITLLQKPFSLDVLLRTMREVLDAGA
jgi:two-component system, cell cycle sensor histidine kinase and response regulator CckA